MMKTSRDRSALKFLQLVKESLQGGDGRTQRQEVGVRIHVQENRTDLILRCRYRREVDKASLGLGNKTGAQLPGLV